jgi:hypothetical protein
MVSISVAGFGAEVNLQEVILLFQILFVALVVVNMVFAPDGTDVLQSFQDNVIGFPECKGFFCVAPSAESLYTASDLITLNFQQTTGVGDFFKIIFTTFDIIKGLIGSLVAASILLAGIQYLYSYYFYWGVFQRD